MTMSIGLYPVLLSAPTMAATVPCFRFQEWDHHSPAGRAARRQSWDDRCTRILEQASDGRRSNAEIAARIEAETGMRFSASVITRHRRAMGFARPRHNEWTSALRRWKPWQGHLARKS